MALNEKLGSGFVDITLRDEKLNRGIDRLQNRMRTVGRRLSSMGSQLTTKLTLPIAGAVGASTKFAADFESSMAKIEGLVGVAGSSVNAMNDEVLRMSEEVGRSPGELADALFFVTSAGLRGKEAMDTLRASAKAAAAGLGETRTVADAATSAMNAYGAENLSAEQAVSTLVSTVREGKVEAADLSGVIGRIVPITAELGIGFDEVGASLASMTRIGLDARQSATAMRGILRAIIKPSKQAKERLSEFGLSMADLRNTAEREGILPLLLQLQERFGDNQEALSDIFPRVRGLVGVLSLVGKNAKNAEQIFQSLKGTTGDDLNQAFETASETASFKFQQSLAKLRRALIRFGNKAIPIVIPLIDKLTGLIDQGAKAFENLSPWVQKLILGAVAFAAALGPVLLAIGQIVLGLSALAGVVSTVFSAIGPVFIGVLAIMAAAVVTFWDTNKTVWQNLSNLWEMVFATAKVVFNKLKEVFNTVFPIIKKLWKEWAGFIGKTIKEMGNQFKNFIGTLIDLFGRLPKPIQNVIKEFGKWFIAAAALFPILAPFINVLGVLATALSAVATAVGLVASFLTLPFVPLILLGVLIGSIIGLAWVFRDEVVAAIKSMAMGVIKWSKKMISGGIEKIKDAWEWLKGKLVGSSIIPDMMDDIGAQFDRLPDLMTKKTEKETSATAELFESLNKRASGLFEGKGTGRKAPTGAFAPSGAKQRSAAGFGQTIDESAFETNLQGFGSGTGSAFQSTLNTGKINKLLQADLGSLPSGTPSLGGQKNLTQVSTELDGEVLTEKVLDLEQSEKWKIGVK